MTPRHTSKEIPAATYDPSSERRDESRHPDAIKGLWYRELKPSEILAGITIAVMAAALLGLRFTSITSLDARVSKVESRQDMESYILCVMVRRTDPESTPPDCAPIIKSRGAP